MYTDDERVYLDELRLSCGMPGALSKIQFQQRKHGELSYQALSVSEKSLYFESLMHNRLIMGALRYGRLKCFGKQQYSRIESILKHLKIYQETGNQEHLVDIANLAMLEFEEPGISYAHWNPLDDSEHTEIVCVGEES
jgi:hypothetical protein